MRDEKLDSLMHPSGRAQIAKDGPRSIPGTFYWKVIDLTRGYAIMTALDSEGGAVHYAETRGYTIIGEDCNMTTKTENLLRSYLQLRTALRGARASFGDGLEHGFNSIQRRNIREIDLPIIKEALADSDQALKDAGLFPVE